MLVNESIRSRSWLSYLNPLELFSGSSYYGLHARIKARGRGKGELIMAGLCREIDRSKYLRTKNRSLLIITRSMQNVDSGMKFVMSDLLNEVKYFGTSGILKLGRFTVTK